MKRIPKVDVEAIISAPELPEEIQDRTKWPKIYNYTAIDNQFLSELQEKVYRIIAAYGRRHKNPKAVLGYLNRPPLLLVYREDSVTQSDVYDPPPDSSAVIQIPFGWTRNSNIARNGLQAITSAFKMNPYEDRATRSLLICGLMGSHATYREYVRERLDKEEILLNFSQRKLSRKKRSQFQDFHANEYRRREIERQQRQIELLEKSIRQAKDEIESLKEKMAQTKVPDIKELLK